jgi:hypothetical protein
MINANQVIILPYKTYYVDTQEESIAKLRSSELPSFLDISVAFLISCLQVVTHICQKYVYGSKVNYSASNLGPLLKGRLLDN